jgi:uncharacterized membrane protein (UPF0136 family)
MAATILWIYIGFLVVAGLLGFWLGKSKISLIMSVIFAIALSLCAASVLPSFWVAVLLSLLLIVFFARLRKTKKFIPAGLMLALTLLTLILTVL